MQQERYRVAQWATGHTGMHSLRKIIEHPRYDLVSLYVYSDEKAGRDAGDLCGGASIGITATKAIEDVIASRPDCVMYMPKLDSQSIDDMCRLLESGANIVTTVERFHHLASIDPKERKRLESACERGGTSLHSTGPVPGFITEVLPLALTLLERRLDRLSIVQCADLSDRQSPEMLNRFFGIDAASADLSEIAERSVVADGQSLRQLADVLGTPLDDVVVTVELALATKTVEISVTTIEAGTVGAWRMAVTGLRGGKPYLEYARTMYVTKDLDPAWELRDTGWHVVVEGDAPLDVEIKFAKDNYGPVSPGYNAHIAVNAIPAVCDAPPGIRTADELRLAPFFG